MDVTRDRAVGVDEDLSQRVAALAFERAFHRYDDRDAIRELVTAAGGSTVVLERAQQAVFAMGVGSEPTRRLAASLLARAVPAADRAAAAGDR